MDRLTWTMTLTFVLYSSSLWIPMVNAGTVSASSLSTNLTTVDLDTKKVSNVTKNDPPSIFPLQSPLVTGVSEPRDFGLSLLLIVTVGFILLLPILLILALIFLVPIPSIYFPIGTLLTTSGVLVTGRRMGLEATQTMRGILESDVCMQRISCEIMRASKGIGVDKWLYRMINEFPMGNELKWKITRAANGSRNCKRYVCDPMSSIWNMF